MRVIQVVDTLQAGGAERVAVDLANGLLKSGFQVYFCATRRTGDLQQELHPGVVFFCLHRKHTFEGLLEFRKKIIAAGIRIIHAHGNSTASFCVLSLIGTNTKIIHHDHNPVLDKRNIFLEKLILKRCHSWIVVSVLIERWATVKIGFNNVILLFNPVNVERFTQSSNEKRSNALARGVVLANYRPQKDYINLLESLKAYNHMSVRVIIDCYGSHFESKYRRMVETVIQQWELGDQIKLHPSTSEVPQKLAEADFGVLSSEEEGLPISLLEYMASSLPVIVTDAGECARIVTESACGIVVPIKDAILLSLGVEKIANNPELRHIFGENGRAYVIKNHGIENFVLKIKQLYSELYFEEPDAAPKQDVL
jgi:glycosyltransferase involved in cell wall biosynthesis